MTAGLARDTTPIDYGRYRLIHGAYQRQTADLALTAVAAAGDENTHVMVISDAVIHIIQQG